MPPRPQVNQISNVYMAPNQRHYSNVKGSNSIEGLPDRDIPDEEPGSFSLQSTVQMGLALPLLTSSAPPTKASVDGLSLRSSPYAMFERILSAFDRPGDDDDEDEYSSNDQEKNGPLHRAVHATSASQFAAHFQQRQLDWLDREILKEQRLTVLDLDLPVYLSQSLPVNEVVNEDVDSPTREGYGADGEGSPESKSDSQQVSVRTKLKGKLHRRVFNDAEKEDKRLTDRLHSTLGQSGKHPCDYIAEASGSTERKKSVTFIEEEWKQCKQSSTRSTSKRPISPPILSRPRSLTSPPYSPHLNALQGQDRKGKKKAVVSKWNSSRPASLLFKQSSINKVHLPQGGQSAPADFDPVEKHNEWEAQRSATIEEADTRRPSRSRTHSNSSGISLKEVQEIVMVGAAVDLLDEEQETIYESCMSSPPVGGFSVDGAVRLRGLDAPSTAGVDALWEEAQRLVDEYLQRVENPPTPPAPLSPEKEMFLNAWMLDTYQETVTQDDAQPTNCQNCSPSLDDVFSSGWGTIPVVGPSRRRSLRDPHRDPLIFQPEENTMKIVSSVSITIGSSDLEGMPPSPCEDLSRRNAQGSQNIIAPKPCRPLPIPSVLIFGAGPAQDSPIKRTFDTMPRSRKERKCAQYIDGPSCLPSKGHIRAQSESDLTKEAAVQMVFPSMSQSNSSVAQTSSGHLLPPLPGSPTLRRRPASVFLPRSSRIVSLPLQRPSPPAVLELDFEVGEALEQSAFSALGLGLCLSLEVDDREEGNSQSVPLSCSVSEVSLYKFSAGNGSPVLPQDEATLSSS